MQNGNGWLRFLERSELLEQWLRLLSVHVHGLLPPVVAPCSATEVLAHGLMATQQNRAGGLSWAARRTRATRQAADWPTTTTLGPCQSVGFPLPPHPPVAVVLRSGATRSCPPRLSPLPTRVSIPPISLLSGSCSSSSSLSLPKFSPLGKFAFFFVLHLS